MFQKGFPEILKKLVFKLQQYDEKLKFLINKYVVLELSD